MNTWLNRIFRFSPLLLAAYWALLFVLTHLPPTSMPKTPVFPNADKAEHFIGYGILAFVAAAAWTWRRTLVLRDYVKVFAGVACYGAIDELLQSLPMINRSCDLFDWLADIAGAAAALCLFAALARVARRRGMKLQRPHAAHTLAGPVASRAR